MLNQVVLMGRLTHEPELKHTNGVAYLRFSIAVDKRVKKDAEKQADFFDVIAWRNTAVFVEKYFHKGDMIALSGVLETSLYTEQDTGKTRKSVTVRADQVSFCGSKQKESAPTEAPPVPTAFEDYTELPTGQLEDFE